MPGSAETRGYGRVFDAVAGEYERHRPTYPDELIDRACQAGRLEPGARVLEIGCGTGQLTRSLLARGLRMTAVEPGAQLIARAREALAGLGEVEFVNSRFEDASVPRGRFGAVFSASALHWIDPDVGWRKIAGALAEGGLIGLFSYFGLEDEYSSEDQRALRAIWREVAPDLLAQWPDYRDLDATLEGVALRGDNVSKAWAWLGSYDIGRDYAADLFDDVQLVALPGHLEQTAAELMALLGTMSYWARLSPAQRDSLTAFTTALERRLGRPIRSSTVACLMTARRAAPRL
jgi:SAM-dependent methyltransferase